MLWAWIYDGGYGTLNGVLLKLGIIDEYKAWLSAYEIPGLGPASLYLVVIAFVWNSAPLVALFILAALQSVPTNLYRAALAGPLRDATRKQVEEMLAECLILLADSCN